MMIKPLTSFLFNLKKIILFILIFVFSGNYLAFGQFDIPEKPKLQTSVYDYISLLSEAQKNSLEQKLIKYSDTTSTQIVVAIISSTQGEDINFLGAQWGHTWGIGQAKEDNGVFILLAKDDRKIAINTGYGVEHLLTDAMTKRIIENDIIPFFRQNNYSEGLNRGTDAIFEVLQGEYTNTQKTSNTKNPISSYFIIGFIILIFILSFIKSKHNGGGNGGHHNSSGGMDIWDAIILSNMGRGNYNSGKSSGWGGSSGGSFGGGFGGGGFGGGGASGGW